VNAWLLAGAGPKTGPKSFRHHDALVKSLGKKQPVIAYVGAASGDSLVFEKMLSTAMFGLGTKVHSVKLTKKATKTSEAKSLLEGADVIFVSGGDVDHGMNVLHERDLAPFFRSLAAKGKWFEGISAGSIMLGQHWVRFHDDDSTELFDCLGVVPFSFDAHDEPEWGELVALAKHLPADRTVYGLTSSTCAVWDGKKLSALGGGLARVKCGPKPKRLADLAP
jgi:dipeptidase E